MSDEQYQPEDLGNLPTGMQIPGGDENLAALHDQIQARNAEEAASATPNPGGMYDDAAMLKLYNNIQNREPAEPDMPASMRPSLDGLDLENKLRSVMEAHLDWKALPAADRKELAASSKSLELMKAAAKEFGLEIKSPSDLREMQRLMRGGESEPADDSSARALSALAPTAKSTAEAVKQIETWTKHIATNGARGWRDLAASYNVSPVQMLTPAERQQIVREEAMRARQQLSFGQMSPDQMLAAWRGAA